MSPAAPDPLALDGGWGWVVVMCSFMALLLGYGSPQAVGILYPEWLLTFGEGKAMTAWVGSLSAGVGLLLGPICSVCVVSFGARPVAVFSGVMVAGGLMLSTFAPNISFLVFSYGFVVGLGVGLLYTAIITIICQYFDKKRGLALGLISTGTSVGGAVFASMQSRLIELFGADGCLLIVGALALNVVACAGLMRPLTPPTYYLKQRAATAPQVAVEGEPPTKETMTSPFRRKDLFCCSSFTGMIKIKTRYCLQCLSSILMLLRDRLLVVLCICLFLYALGNSPAQLFLEDLALSSRLTGGIAAVSLVSLYSIGGGVGKLGLGIMVDVLCINGMLLYAITVAASGLAVLLIPFSRSYLDLQVVSLVLGFGSGNWTLTPYICSRLVGVEKLAEAHGILMLFGGVGLTLGPPVVGCFYDITQSYDLPFFVSGSCMLAGSFALFFAAFLSHNKTLSPPTDMVNSCTVTMATDTLSSYTL